MSTTTEPVDQIPIHKQQVLNLDALAQRQRRSIKSSIQHIQITRIMGASASVISVTPIEVFRTISLKALPEAIENSVFVEDKMLGEFKSVSTSVISP